MDIINQGLKVLTLELNGVKLKDSYAFLPMALSAIPKAFGLAEAKGHFPFLAFTRANRKYKGPYFGAACYGANNLKEGKRTELLDWLKAQEDKEFNMAKEVAD